MHFLKMKIPGIILICRLAIGYYLYNSDSFYYFYIFHFIFSGDPMCTGKISGGCSTLCRFLQHLPQTHLRLPEHPRVLQLAFVMVLALLCSNERANCVFWKHFSWVWVCFLNYHVRIFVKYVKGRHLEWSVVNPVVTCPFWNKIVKWSPCFFLQRGLNYGSCYTV